MAKQRAKTMSEVLRHAIETSGKTRYRISVDTGISESVLSRFVSGERGLSMEAIDVLLKYLELEVVQRKPEK